MDLDGFKQSLTGEAPPTGIGGAVEALWWERKGDWNRAHACAQSASGQEGAWAHAYLHRVEGDLSNAGGWYRRAGKATASGPLAAEWETIARALLAAHPG